jgi:hypothetical protein
MSRDIVKGAALTIVDQIRGAVAPTPSPEWAAWDADESDGADVHARHRPRVRWDGPGRSFRESGCTAIAAPPTE